MRTYYATGEASGFSLGLFGTLVFGPFLLLGWLFTLPFRLGRSRELPVLVVDHRYQREIDPAQLEFWREYFEREGR